MNTTQIMAKLNNKEGVSVQLIQRLARCDFETAKKVFNQLRDQDFIKLHTGRQFSGVLTLRGRDAAYKAATSGRNTPTFNVNPFEMAAAMAKELGRQNGGEILASEPVMAALANATNLLKDQLIGVSVEVPRHSERKARA